MEYKVLACDFDDTLFSNNTHTLSEKNREAIRLCETHGIKFILVTGRNLKSIGPYYRDLRLKTPVITTGGAEIYDASGNRIYQKGLKYEDTIALLKRAKELGVHAHVYRGDSFVYEKYVPVLDFYVNHCKIEGIEDPSLLSLPPEAIKTPKLLMISDPERVNDLQKQLAGEFAHLNVVKSLNMFVEFYDKGTSKGTALEYLMDDMGFYMDEVAAAGDTQIDISMLKKAGFSAAPSNAMKDVLAVVDVILNDCDHDCVYQLVTEHLLKDRV